MKGSRLMLDLLKSDYPNELQSVVGVLGGMAKELQLKKFCQRYDCSKFNLSEDDRLLLENMDKKVEKLNALLLSDELKFDEIVRLSTEIAEICGMGKKKMKETISILESFRTRKAS